MTTMRRLLIVALPLAVSAVAQPRFARPPSSAPKVELKGVIERVLIVPGLGMPFLEVRDKKDTVRVYLGSMRYLIEKDFKPAAGEFVTVRGFKVEGGIVAIRVEVPSAKMSIDLRDEDGTPLWRRGRWQGR